MQSEVCYKTKVGNRLKSDESTYEPQKDVLEGKYGELIHVQGRKRCLLWSLFFLFKIDTSLEGYNVQTK